MLTGCQGSQGKKTVVIGSSEPERDEQELKPTTEEDPLPIRQFI